MLEILEQLKSSKYLVKKCRLNIIKKENKSNSALAPKLILIADGKPSSLRLITNQTALMKLKESLLMGEEFLANKTKEGKH
jgi:hypothetical protein